MPIILDNAFDTHFIHVEDTQDNSLNIIVRTLLDISIDNKYIEEAINELLFKHPYLKGKVTDNHAVNSDRYPFCLSIDDDVLITPIVEEVKDEELDTSIQQISAMRFHRFYSRQGEMLKLCIWRSHKRTLIELACPHLLTDLQGGIMLMSDLCYFLDNCISGTALSTTRSERLMFDEVRYGWDSCNSVVKPVKVDTFPEIFSAQWAKPESTYQRNRMPSKEFVLLKEWLIQNKVKAKVSDLFYYVITKLYKNKYDIDLSLLTTFSFRTLLDGEVEQKNINTSAVFFPIDMSQNDLNKPQKWMEDFHSRRMGLMDKNGVLQVINFFRSLNQAMDRKNVLYNRQVINQFKSMGTTLLVNNIGSVDKFFNSFSNFQVAEIDIQDGVPGEEIRMFGFNDTIYINPMFKKNSVLSSKDFFSFFMLEINQLTHGAL